MYTAIFGRHAQLMAPVNAGNTRFICFTDERPDPPSATWEIEVRPAKRGTPRMDAKWFKMNPHDALPGCDLSIWIDGSIRLTSAEEFVRMCLAAVDGNGIAFYAHPERQDIYKEVEESRKLPQKYGGEPMEEQVASYRSEGLPDDHGLWAGGIIVRDHRVPWVRELNERWLGECEQWSIQDQLSLPYVFWKLERRPAEIQIGCV